MILDKTSFFLLGIKGSAMANIAVMLKEMGKKVSGVDIEEEFITDSSLIKNQIEYSTNFLDFSSIDQYDVFVYSAAHGGSENPLIIEAQKKGKRILSQPQLIAEFVEKHPLSIAVAGCHGKTTTSSLLAWALGKLGKDPGFLIGAPLFDGGGGGKVTGSDYFVVEADEYGVHPPQDKTPKLLFLHPHIVLCMNIDFDHPDVYKDLEMTKKTFMQFFSQAQKLILCGDDPHIRSLIPSLTNQKFLMYGTTDDCDYQIVKREANAVGISFEMHKLGVSQGVFSSVLFGEKNILNCAGVVATLLEMGFSAHEVRTAIAGFSGAKRRMEMLWTDTKSYLIDDYGHHPAEIAATISALRSRFVGKKLHVLFQPHTYSRTEELKNEFVAELSQADYVYVLPIFASAREDASTFRITSGELSLIAMRKGNNTIVAFDDKLSLLAHLKQKWNSGDVVLTLGAGDIYKLKDDIIGILNEQSI